jgi:hypothetical protein
LAAKHDAETLFAKLAEEEAAAHPEPPLDIAPEDWITFLLFWGLAGVVFLQFFTRYVLNDSLTWTEEIAQYLLMVITFAGSAMAARRGTHITVEFLLNKLPTARAASRTPWSRRWRRPSSPSPPSCAGR